MVGVAAPGFRGVMPVATPVLWAPLTMQPQLQARESLWEVRGNNQFNVVGRLAEGTTVEQARAGLDAVNRQLAQEHPEQYRGSGITVVPQSDAGLHPVMASAQVAVSAVLMGVVGLLLLLACVNLANLFLARARERRREMAIRASIGASRGRLVRQLLAEALILSLMAGALALLLARVAVTLANGLTLPIDIPFAAGLEIGWPVVAFALGVSLLAGLLFGLVPALEASRPDLVSGLKDGSDRGGGYRRSLMSRGLVVAQIALSLVLLVNAGLFLRSLREATHLERGFDADRLLLASVDPSLQGYDPERTRVFFDQLVQRVRAIPGVRAAALGEMVPLGINNQQGEVSVPGHVYADDERTAVDYHHAAAGYFETMGIPMEEGRGFTEQDAGQNVVVINRRFADRFWPGESALGRTIVRRDVEYTVIGVTSTGRYRSLGETPLEYMHFQLPERWSSALTLHVRTSGDPSLALPLVRRELGVLDPSLPLFDVMTMERHLGLTLLPARIAGGALGLFGLIGLLLAGVGTYGVLAVSVAQRTREIGIRMALGAAGGRVVRLVLGQTLRMVGMGVLIGLVGAAFLGRAVEGMLYGVSGADPVAFGAVSILLVGVALVASVVPAWRAVRVEPVGALRGE